MATRSFRRSGKKSSVYAVLLIISVLISLFFLTSCCGSKNAAFVQEVACAVSEGTDSPDMFYDGGNSFEFDLSKPALAQPYFVLQNLHVKADRNDPSVVHYSCRIPGLVAVSFNAAFGVCFSNITEYSDWVEVSGDVRVITSDDGSRKIDISGVNNAFAAFATLRYTGRSIFESRGIDLSEGITQDNRQYCLAALESIGANPYSAIAGMSPSEYIDKVVKPDIASVNEHSAELSADFVSHNKTGYSRYDSSQVAKQILMACGLITVIVIAAAILSAGFRNRRKALNTKKNYWYRNPAVDKLRYPKDRKVLVQLAHDDADEYVRRHAVRLLPYPAEREILSDIALTDIDDLCRKYAIEKLSYPEDRDVFREVLVSDEDGAVRHAAFDNLKYPEDADLIIDLVRSAKDNSYLRQKAIEALPDPTASRSERGAAAYDALKDKERDAVNYAALNDEEYSNREAAIKKLTYPEDRDTLLNVIRKDSYGPNRRLSMSKCTGSDNVEIFREAAASSDDEDRKAAIEKLSYNDAPDIMLDAALNDKKTAVRLTALRKLPYNKHRDAIRTLAENTKRRELSDAALWMLSYPEDRDLLVKAVFDRNADKDLREHIVRDMLTYPDDRDALFRLASDSPELLFRKIATGRLPYSEVVHKIFRMALECDYYGELTESDLAMCERAAVIIALDPDSGKENMDALMSLLCRSIQRGITGNCTKKYVTLAGWSAAALGRLLTVGSGCSADEIRVSREHMKPAIDEYSKIIEKVQEKYKEYESMRNLAEASSSFRSSLRSISDEIEFLHSRLSIGLGGFMLKNGDRPLAWLISLLSDNQSRVPRFVRQGVIMGLVDWLTANASQPEAADVLEVLLRVRADMITSDNELSFFEVRVPEGCQRCDYERILDFVLHCSNPSLKYASAASILDVAETEVRGYMEMLRACPLRLIDPANQTTLGFYQFKPYIHAMWTQYRPPVNEGPVIARYHEVDDRTRPLSSGLNVRLFTDPYSVIPTLYHEHEHFAGDPNEASVFLKTQIFSIAFYRKYTAANPRKDAVFAELTAILGMPPSSAKCGDLNDLIRKYYGEKVSQAKAEQIADSEILRINTGISFTNMNEKWGPDIKFPMLTDEEDKENKDLIREISIRYATVPKSITESEFRNLCS